MMQDRILCVQPGFVVSEEAIQQKLEHIPDDQLECRVWARECPGITQSMTEHHALFVDTFRSFLTNGGDEETIVENLSFLSVHIRLLLVCCDYVLRRVGDVDALGWPILYISSLNASIAECFLVGMKACKSFLQLTETETDPTRSAFVDRLSAEVDKLFGQCFTLLKMYIEMVQKFFPPKADTEAGDSDVVEFVLGMYCFSLLSIYKS
ncbi:hypothetical protein SARC_04410 [Sphaeroforma arctica JP610]|uniref:Uncharacterized protein n=1 Tax=Sphaeroforma arctica JP610 TaxID=667725 RepID=A0A0L0G392_9EUKA|nr:hypothetical protein, variant [Sphaeroforma arctica JP610]XP_014157242.1 hypothetical protein SARC_04410 [Sphaeroforma arctica JP610]KNC83339.1 hypothetical protein, variant [Sphaeroforma arctica JP610]KNC83340.1 hypothetical protein SARC_04410 [Sphaeroforma arctica JP610]|eukprot:XP_014157241.1 hypothetical protein, variant [Sphaeroforma arctica JP610]